MEKKTLMEKMEDKLVLEGEIVGEFSFELLEPRDAAVHQVGVAGLPDICTSTSTSCDCTSSSSSCC